MKRQQKGNGHVFRSGKSWFGRWWRDEFEKDAEGNSHIVRRQHCEKLCEVSDRYRTRRDVQPLLDKKLQALNAGLATAESTLTVAEYGDKHFLPYAERELKPSTVYGYRGLWKMYLRPQLEKITLGDFRCKHATEMLEAIHQEHGVGRATLRHCKALLSVIFRHAKRSGILDGANPAQDAGIPHSAAASKPTHAYSVQEVFAMLDALRGAARTAIALMFFCGLRPGEARAAKWDDYNPKTKTLKISASMWRTITTTPKTPESVASVPVAETLADILAESARQSAYILASPTGQAINLPNLVSRMIVPALAVCADCRRPQSEHDITGHEFQPLPKWHGFYALRRGCATLATSVDSQMAAKSLLRHSNIATTSRHYIKSIPAEAIRAVGKMDALFQKSEANAAPN